MNQVSGKINLRALLSNRRTLGLVLALGMIVGLWAWRQSGVGGGPAVSAAKPVDAADGRAGGALSLAGEPMDAPVSGNWTGGRGSGPRATDPVTVWLAAPFIPADRDLFFAPVMVPTPLPARNPVPRPVDEDVDRRKSAAFRVAAADLKLTSVVGGGGAPGSPAEPMALLNGRWVACGGEVDGFRVVRIESRAVVVERDGRKLEVRLK